MNRGKLALRASVALVASIALITVTVQSAAAAVVTTSHTGSGAPALAQVGARLYVAWTGSTGTPAARALNFGWSTAQGQNIVRVSYPEKSPQNEGPALSADPDSATGVFLAWPDGLTANTLTISYFDGTAFSCRTSYPGITTAHSPALAVDSSGKLYLAWTDPTSHLNIALIVPDCAVNHTIRMFNRTVLPQTSAYGPSMVWDDSGSSNLRFLVAWVTNDAAHSVNVGQWPGSSSLQNIRTTNTTVYATSGPSISSAVSDLFLTFRGSDNYRYVGYSEGCVPTCFGATNTGTLVKSGIGSEPGGYLNAWFNSAGNLTISSLF